LIGRASTQPQLASRAAEDRFQDRSPYVEMYPRRRTCLPTGTLHQPTGCRPIHLPRLQTSSRQRVSRCIFTVWKRFAICVILPGYRTVCRVPCATVACHV